MRETKQKQIGDYTYAVTQFGAKQGGRVMIRLLKIVGGAAGEAMKGDNEFDMSTVGSMITNLAETLQEDDFDYLCETFAAASTVQGGEFPNPIPLTTEGVFDLHFAGKYLELGQWLLFAVDANFGFLGENGIVERAKRAAIARRGSAQVDEANKSKSQSPNTLEPVGLSGAS